MSVDCSMLSLGSRKACCHSEKLDSPERLSLLRRAEPGGAGLHGIEGRAEPGGVGVLGVVPATGLPSAFQAACGHPSGRAGGRRGTQGEEPGRGLVGCCPAAPSRSCKSAALRDVLLIMLKHELLFIRRDGAKLHLTLTRLTHNLQGPKCIG